MDENLPGWMRQKSIELYQRPVFKQHGLEVHACYRMLYVCRSLVPKSLGCWMKAQKLHSNQRNCGTWGQVANPILWFLSLANCLSPLLGSSHERHNNGSWMFSISVKHSPCPGIWVGLWSYHIVKVWPCPGQVELGLVGWLLFYPFACLFTTAKLDLSLLFSYPLQTSCNFYLAY